MIGGEVFSSYDIRLLTGEETIAETKEHILLVARALRNPLGLPWIIKEICSLSLDEEEMKEMRLSLIRVQVDAELRMNQDIQRYQQRRYVAQVIEILLFNELLLAPREASSEDLE